MTDSNYRTLVGVVLIVALYFHLDGVSYALIAMLLIEGLTNLRVPIVVNRVTGRGASAKNPDEALTPFSTEVRFEFGAERMWRLVVATMLIVSLSLSELGYFWLLPWFMGFAIFGAGLSRVCPILIAIKWAGFR
jgi:hypothetical protein